MAVRNPNDRFEFNKLELLLHVHVASGDATAPNFVVKLRNSPNILHVFPDLSTFFNTRRLYPHTPPSESKCMQNKTPSPSLDVSAHIFLYRTLADMTRAMRPVGLLIVLASMFLS